MTNLQEMFDRLEITVNQYVEKPSLNTSLQAETFGYTSIAVTNDLNSTDIKDLEREFEYVNFIDGKIILSDKD